MKFRILIQQDEDGVFVAECPTLPGCISQGRTRTEAVANIQDAMSGYVVSLEKHNEPISITFEDDEPLTPNIDEDTAGLLALSGTWEDDRPVENIIQSIYEIRSMV